MTVPFDVGAAASVEKELADHFIGENVVAARRLRARGLRQEDR
jgi:hypothetical protein